MQGGRVSEGTGQLTLHGGDDVSLGAGLSGDLEDALLDALEGALSGLADRFERALDDPELGLERRGFPDDLPDLSLDGVGDGT